MICQRVGVRSDDPHILLPKKKRKSVFWQYVDSLHEQGSVHRVVHETAVVCVLGGIGEADTGNWDSSCVVATMDLYRSCETHADRGGCKCYMLLHVLVLSRWST